MNALEETKERERQARRHGRHIKLEQELNAIGLSLFAPPFGRPEEEEEEEDAMVSFNEWEGIQKPSSNLITVYHEGGVIHEVKGLPADTIIEFRDSDIKECDHPEDLETIDGVKYYIIRFANE